MKEFSENLIRMLGSSIWQYGETKAEATIFSESVVTACRQNFCGNYNSSWRCPPAIGTLEQLKAHFEKYSNVFVYTTKHRLRDSYDFEGMAAAQKEHERTDDIIREYVKSGGGELLGAGKCSVCEKCAYPLPCLFPDKARTSIEACGINVMSLAQTVKINYANGKDTVTYFSAVFF